MRWLALTTATPRFEAALFDGDPSGAALAQCDYDDEMAHAERSLATIAAMFAARGLGPDWIEAIAVDIGPGSFTGVRVGLAAAKGIALARGVPLVGVCSLSAMAAAAFAARDDLEVVTSVLDAKRGEVFHASYARDGAELAPPTFTTRGGLALRGHACGRAARAEVAEPRFVDVEEALLPHARWIAILASAALASGQQTDLGSLEPIYARAPDAQKPSAPPRLSRA